MKEQTAGKKEKEKKKKPVLSHSCAESEESD